MGRPRKAATVILLRQESEDRSFRVYMTKRPESMRFMGGFHVFPGGAVESEDDIGNGDGILDDPGAGMFPERPFWIAAVRELFEETGVLLARDSRRVWVDGARFSDARWALIRGTLTFPQFLRGEKLQLDLTIMKYFGRRVTPPLFSPIRFDTAFFLVTPPRMQTPEPYSGEVVEDAWIAPRDALLQWERGAIRLALPTLSALALLARFSHVEEVMRNDQCSFGEPPYPLASDKA
jgi:8-oxo-dGTP pyrophosphatase MutT (NUDIX family)